MSDTKLYVLYHWCDYYFVYTTLDKAIKAFQMRLIQHKHFFVPDRMNEEEFNNWYNNPKIYNKYHEEDQTYSIFIINEGEGIGPEKGVDDDLIMET